MKARAAAGVLTATALALACTSTLDEPLQGANTVSGQVGGHSLALQDTVVQLFPAGSGGGLGVPRLFLVLSSAGALCLDYEGAGGLLQHKNETRFVLEVHFAGQPAPGTYPVDLSAPASTSHATGQFVVTDAVCGNAFTQASDAGGSVTITILNASEIAGSFDVSFGGGGSLKGSFHRSRCPDFVDRNAPGCK